MDSEPQSVPRLLQLPDFCLLAVLRCCADDPRSLFSAARAHSRLHQAAVLAANSISVVLTQQQQADSVLLYLTNHGQQVSSISLSLIPPADDSAYDTGLTISLRELPESLHRLDTLLVRGLHVQLQPGDGFAGVLHAEMPLKQLQLDTCELIDREAGLAAALPLLPTLQHLSIADSDGHTAKYISVPFPSSVLQELQQLTYLELAACRLQDPDSVQHMQALTCLQDLRLDLLSAVNVTASTLSGAQQLTRLQLRGSEDARRCCRFEGAVLAGRTLLLHFALQECVVQGGAAGVTELLSHLQDVRQLTHLDLGYSLQAIAPTAAYSALTASSKLQHLDISECVLPAGVWQHLFPADRRLPHLRVLDIGYVRHPSGAAAAREGSRLVSCCPGLQSLWIPCSAQGLQYSSGLLAPLAGLSGLHELMLDPRGGSTEGLDEVCLLTQLKQLWLWGHSEEGLLLQLTQLSQLTKLECSKTVDGEQVYCKWVQEVSSRVERLFCPGACCLGGLCWCFAGGVSQWRAESVVGNSAVSQLQARKRSQPVAWNDNLIHLICRQLTVTYVCWAVLLTTCLN